MPPYATGLMAALLAPIVHAWSNIIDSEFSNNIFPRLSVLMLFSMLCNLAFLPIVVFISMPRAIPLPLLGIVFIIALIETLYLFPYYWSLKRADTSIVAALFSVGEVAVPVLAYLFLHERLQPLQYCGFMLVILSAIMLTLDVRKLRFNAAFFFMLGASLVLALEAILYKYVYLQGVGWGSVIVYGTFFQVLIIVPLAFAGGIKPIRDGYARVRKNGRLFIVNEFFGATGNLAGSFALSAIPVSIAKGLGSAQPAFVLGYAYLFRKKNPEFFKETVGAFASTRKLFFFALTIIGVILVVL